MRQITTITGSYSEKENGWVSNIVKLTGDVLLDIELPSEGMVVIKKAEKIQGPYPKALITKWSGPKFRIKLYGSTPARYIKIITTETPNMIQYANI